MFLRMAGGAAATVGTLQQDAFQGHWHATAGGGHNSNQSSYIQTAITINNSGYQTRGPVSDGTNGTPRTAKETRPSNYAVQYFIKY